MTKKKILGELQYRSKLHYIFADTENYYLISEKPDGNKLFSVRKEINDLKNIRRFEA